MRNILLTIKYDGTNYCGWQRQPDRRTVCGRLEEVLSTFFKMDIKLEGTSRTDAGVHAFGQRATLRADIKVPIEKLPKVINTALADDRMEGMSDIEIVDAKDMPEGFHARFDSKGKRYIYKIRNTEDVDIFKKNYCFHVRQKLNIGAMREAAQYIVGTHDFACFQTAGGNPVETTVRTVTKLSVESEDEFVIIMIEGDGFLYNMVRIIVGTLTDVGLGKKEPKDLKTIIDSKDRGNAGKTAPASGLYLDEIFY